MSAPTDDLRLLVCGQMYYQIDWMRRIDRFVHARPTEVDAVICTGDMCNALESRAPGSRAARTIRAWVERLEVPVYFAPSGYDVEDIHTWDTPNLLSVGDHEQCGWRIHVTSSRHGHCKIPPSSLPTIIVSDAGPTGSVTTLCPGGDSRGRLDLRAELSNQSDVRLVVHGDCIDPMRHVDWAEGAMCLNPGLSYYEHRYDEPAFATVSTATRLINLHDGRSVRTYSFAMNF